MDATAQTINPVFDQPAQRLGKRVVVGSFALSLKNILSQVIITGTNIILARILSPQILGTFIILLFIVGVVSFFADIGLAKALVQRREEPTTEEIQATFTLHLILAFICMVIIWFAAPLIISIYRTQMPTQTIVLLRILAVAIPFTALGGISKALLERHLLYSRYAASEFVMLLSSKGLAIILALSGWGLGSLIIAEVASRLIGSIVFLCLYIWHIGLNLKFRLLRPFILFGIPYQISTVITLFQGAVIPFYVALFPGPGHVTGTQASGLITFAAGLAVFTRFFSEIVSQLLFPILARRQHDRHFIERLVERGIFISAVSSFGIGVVIWIWAPELITHIYSSKWLPALPSLYILLVSAILCAISAIGTSALLALGNARRYTNIQFATTLVQWIFTILFVYFWGFIGYAMATIFAACVPYVAFMYLKISIWGIIKKLALIFISTFCTYVLMYFVKPTFNVNSIIMLIFVCGLTTGIYVLLLTLTLRRKILMEIKAVTQTFAH